MTHTNKIDPQPFENVLDCELSELQVRRMNVNISLDRAKKPQYDTTRIEAESAFERAHQLSPLGVCLSGGGIRSATFGLGILQGLCERQLLPYVDYLSTVSGGGYIGSWLHSVIKHGDPQGDPLHAQKEIKETTQNRRKARSQSEESNKSPVDFLRKYSSYLAPRHGLLSADTWAIGTIWSRNMFLNLLIIVPFLMALVLSVRGAGMFYLSYVDDAPELWEWILPLSIAVVIVTWGLLAVLQRELSVSSPKAEGSPPWFAKVKISQISSKFSWVGVGAVLVAAFVLGAHPYERNGDEGWTLWFTLWGLFLLQEVVGGFALSFLRTDNAQIDWPGVAKAVLSVLCVSAVCATVTALCMNFTWSFLQRLQSPHKGWLHIAFGPPMMVLIWIAAMGLQIGLMGTNFPDAAREWLAKFGSELLILAAGLSSIILITVYAPFWLLEFSLRQQPTGQLVPTILTAAWLLSGIASGFAGSSGKTIGAWADLAGSVSKAVRFKNNVSTENPAKSWTLEKIAVVGPPIFIVLSLVLVSLGTQCLFTPFEIESPISLDTVIRWLTEVRDKYWQLIEPPNDEIWKTCLLFIACSGLTALLSWRFNINEFSMHYFYKNRLVRCFLGGGRNGSSRHRQNRERDPAPLTGFDPADDIHISTLCPRHGYNGPYPIVNCTLNVNAGTELATAERKASSFIFTPLACGFDPKLSKTDCDQKEELSLNGYRNTESFMDPRGPTLGTAMAISGAALNPNSGYHTSPAMAFLLTAFDVRLGWWVGNPRREAESCTAGPRFALGSLLSELFAQTTSRSHYVNLSDGGHFENLGIYELVRRRCRYIIAADAEEDPTYSFQALGNAIRKCRADFGVEIEIDTESLRPDLATGLSAAHCVVGTIHYPEEPEVEDRFAVGGSSGHRNHHHQKRQNNYLVYFKANLTGDECGDIKQYHQANPAFPHDSTASQFFGESQFESYRKLGAQAMALACERLPSTQHQASAESHLEDIFQRLYDRWHPAPKEEKNQFTERYCSLLRTFANDKDLQRLGTEFFPTPTISEKKVPSDGATQKALYFSLEAIQLMEDIYFGLDLATQSALHNPLYSGWIQTFLRWAASPTLRETWKSAKNTFNIEFQDFLDQLIRETDAKRNTEEQQKHHTVGACE